MGRRQKLDKLPTTSISISVLLREGLEKSKPRSKTMDEFLTAVFSEWSSFKELKIAAEHWESQCMDAWKSLKEHRQTIRELQEKLGIANDGNSVEPSHGLTEPEINPIRLPQAPLPILEVKEKEVI